MSSSRLKPSVTPVTALATRLRARPWNLPSCGSSVRSLATQVAVGELEVDAGRMRLAQLALRALDLDGAVDHLDGDALGNRDRFSYRFETYLILVRSGAQVVKLDSRRSTSLTLRLAARYQMLQSTSPPTPAFTAARPVMTPRDVVRMLVPRPASTSGTSSLAEVDAAAGAADALHAGNQTLAVRSVFQEQAQRLGLRAWSSRPRRPAA